jgi:hypothetical protein
LTSETVEGNIAFWKLNARTLLVNIKLTSGVAIAIIIACITGLCLIAAVSLSRDQPLILNGQEYGFKRDTRSEKDAEIASLQASLANLRAEHTALLKVYEADQKRLKEFTSPAEILWSPIKDVSLSTKDAEYAHGIKGKWRSPESELELELLEITSSDASLAVNLPEPNNRIRLTKNLPLLINKEKYQYRLTPLTFSYSSIVVRLERRHRP